MKPLALLPQVETRSGWVLSGFSGSLPQPKDSLGEAGTKLYKNCKIMVEMSVKVGKLKSFFY